MIIGRRATLGNARGLDAQSTIGPERMRHNLRQAETNIVLRYIQVFNRAICTLNAKGRLKGGVIMHRELVVALLVFLPFSFVLLHMQSFAQEESPSEPKLPVKFEELTAAEFAQAVELSRSVCIIPMGILEKHGPHLPLGTDMMDAREVSLRAAKKEYSIVFPEYYFGQIYEAKHQPGTIAYSPDLVWNLLQETCDELARNGLKKIVIVNGHGGNRFFLHYFCQAQLANPKDYAVVLFTPESDPEVAEKVKALRKTTDGGHAGETETSMILALRPELAHVERGKDQSGENLKRLEHIPNIFTGIWWYARYPNHYAGDGSQANPEIGELLFTSRADQLANLIKTLKKDNAILRLQREFFENAEKPLKTKQ